VGRDKALLRLAKARTIKALQESAQSKGGLVLLFPALVNKSRQRLREIVLSGMIHAAQTQLLRYNLGYEKGVVAMEEDQLENSNGV
jgi:hypothetical protein